jgi:hypothetical protein
LLKTTTVNAASSAASPGRHHRRYPCGWRRRHLDAVLRSPDCAGAAACEWKPRPGSPRTPCWRVQRWRSGTTTKYSPSPLALPRATPSPIRSCARPPNSRRVASRGTRGSGLGGCDRQATTSEAGRSMCAPVSRRVRSRGRPLTSL